MHQFHFLQSRFFDSEIEYWDTTNKAFMRASRWLYEGRDPAPKILEGVLWIPSSE